MGHFFERGHRNSGESRHVVAELALAHLELVLSCPGDQQVVDGFVVNLQDAHLNREKNRIMSTY
jgi:hypothetical protein